MSHIASPNIVVCKINSRIEKSLVLLQVFSHLIVRVTHSISKHFCLIESKIIFSFFRVQNQQFFLRYVSVFSHLIVQSSWMVHTLHLHTLLSDQEQNNQFFLQILSFDSHLIQYFSAFLLNLLGTRNSLRLKTSLWVRILRLRFAR